MNGYDIVIMEGTSKEGKPYCFAKLDRRIANNPSFIETVKQAGATVIKDGKVSRK